MNVGGEARDRVALVAARAHSLTVHQPLLHSEPLVVLGADRVPPLIPDAVRPDRQTCFGPRGAMLASPSGPLWVCDTGHHRLLGWRRLPGTDRAPADWVIGQADFGQEKRNGGRAPSAYSFNVPTGICRLGTSGLAVADAWNHRVLVWRALPERSNVSADVVLGQADFSGTQANRGRQGPSAETLFWPYGVGWCNGWLFVADSENRRVLGWKGIPERNGQPADLVLGQPDFDQRDENRGSTPDAGSMRWPHAVCWWSASTSLCIADAGNSRILMFQGVPREHGAVADRVLGQQDWAAVDHNQSSYLPRASTLNMPYGLSAAGDWLLCADTANSRLLGYHVADARTGANARALFGQIDFTHKGDNRWQPAATDSVCWPYAVSTSAEGGEKRVVIADSGNNRISVWELAV